MHAHSPPLSFLMSVGELKIFNKTSTAHSQIRRFFHVDKGFVGTTGSGLGQPPHWDPPGVRSFGFGLCFREGEHVGADGLDEGSGS